MPHSSPFKTATTGVLLALLLTGAAHATDYVQAQGSALAFASKYDGMVFTGRFPEFHTTLRFDPDDLANARLDVTIPLASAITGNHDRDSTLKTSDFFHVAQFATARYQATSFRDLGGGNYAADGTLALKGIEKPVTLTFTWEAGTPAILTGSASIQRLEFDVGINDWVDTRTIPNTVSIASKVRLRPAGP